MPLAKQFLEVFIPLFVAIDPFGMIPVFLSVTEGLTPQRRRQVTFESVLTAVIVSIGFMFLGQATFHFLGITENDFKIAGGIILLVLAVLDLLITGKPAVHESEMVGIVPLAMPLIAGPATLTTTLVLANREGYGYTLTALGLAVNFGLLLGALLAAGKIVNWLGMNALRLQQTGHGPPGRHRRQFHPLRHHPDHPRNVRLRASKREPPIKRGERVAKQRGLIRETASDVEKPEAKKRGFPHRIFIGVHSRSSAVS